MSTLSVGLAPPPLAALLLLLLLLLCSVQPLPLPALQQLKHTSTGATTGAIATACVIADVAIGDTPPSGYATSNPGPGMSRIARPVLLLLLARCCCCRC
eukprot:9385-Heterococcus_DN1.PRE.1